MGALAATIGRNRLLQIPRWNERVKGAQVNMCKASDQPPDRMRVLVGRDWFY